jgi:hypothetical protein
VPCPPSHEHGGAQQSLIFLSRDALVFLLLSLHIQIKAHSTLNDLYETNTNPTLSPPNNNHPTTSIRMSAAYEGQDPIAIAKQAERDLNSQGAKQSHTVEDTSRGPAGASDSSMSRSIPKSQTLQTLTNLLSAIESGVDQSVEKKFPGAEVKIGGQGASDNREIPLSEGGDINPVTGKQTKASDFQGIGGPEDSAAIDREVRGGDNDIRDNIRQGGETVRPAGSLSNNAAGGAGKSTQ